MSSSSGDYTDEVELQRKDESDPYKEVYRDSSIFLKGTQSLNPHNDYCQHFEDTRKRPQKFIRYFGLAGRFKEYPKLRELIRLKDELISSTEVPIMRLHLFGGDSTIRPGWVTVGPTLTNTNFNPETYASHFPLPDSHLSGCTEEIERLHQILDF